MHMNGHWARGVGERKPLIKNENNKYRGWMKKLQIPSTWCSRLWSSRVYTDNLVIIFKNYKQIENNCAEPDLQYDVHKMYVRLFIESTRILILLTLDFEKRLLPIATFYKSLSIIVKPIIGPFSVFIRNKDF